MAAFQKNLARLCLEIVDTMAERCGRHAKFLRCGLERSVTRDRFEGAQTCQGGGAAHLRSSICGLRS
jgi:hypothetical protein